MDGETGFETLRATLASLASVNRMSFGYRPITRFLDRATGKTRPSRPLRLVDIGAGYGDGLRAAASWLDRHGIAAELVGVDINPIASRAAREASTAKYRHVDLSWITADVFSYVENAPSPDLVMSSLFCHHLEDEDLPPFLRWMDRSASRGWLVNDLYRSRLAAAGFAFLATALRRHPYVRHDGPVSFARSFRREDWVGYLGEAGIEGAELRMLAPFRLCVEKHAAP
jgi:hypothetical protein